MNEKLKKGIEQIRSIRLSDTEKERVLMTAMKSGDQIKSRKIFPLLDFWHSFAAHHHVFAYAITPLLAVLVIIGTSSYSARTSLPGDTLYPLKLNLNEQFVGLTNISPESKISWEAERAVRRIEEAVSLASHGKLDEENFKVIEENFDKHFGKVEASASASETATSSEKVIEIREELQKKLEEQAKKLSEISEKDEDKNRERAKALEKKIREKIKERKESGESDSKVGKEDQED